MNIALFVDTYLPNINGVVSSVVLLKKVLEEKGHNVYIVTTYKGITKIIEEENGKVIRLPGLELKKLYGYKIAQPFHFLFIERLKELNIDIIHAQQEFGVGIYASIVSRTLKIPLIRTYHTAYADYTSYFLHLEEGSVVDNAAKYVIEQLSKVVGEDCLRLIAPSIKTKEMLEGYGITTPIEVVPTGLELSDFRYDNIDKDRLNIIKKNLGLKNNVFNFVYVGRIGKEKSIDMLIEGFKIAKSKYNNIKLIIVGGGPDLDDLRKMSSNINVDDSIIFTDRVPHQDVPYYYALSDAFLMASLTETQGLTYIEALASGKPLICRKDKVIEEILLDDVNGYSFIDANDLANKIVEFINLNEEDRQNMANKSLELSLKYDANVFGDNILKIYEEVINEYTTGLIIEKVLLKKDNNILLTLGGLREEKIIVSQDTFSDLGLRKGQEINSVDYSLIKQKENYTIAYSKGLKKLAISDVSEKKMREYLYINYSLSQNEIDEIINKYKSLNYINDESYAISKITSFDSHFYSNKMMIRKLKEDGISEDIINKYVLNSIDDEFIKAKNLSQSYNRTIHNKSLRARKETIFRKLVNQGYDIDIANKAIECLNLSNYALTENDTLKAYANKAKLKYERKYSGTELRNRVFKYLCLKGFSPENIYATMNEMEFDDDKTS